MSSSSFLLSCSLSHVLEICPHLLQNENTGISTAFSLLERIQNGTDPIEKAPLLLKCLTTHFMFSKVEITEMVIQMLFLEEYTLMIIHALPKVCTVLIHRNIIHSLIILLSIIVGLSI